MDIQEYIKSGIIESYVLGLADPEEASTLERMRPLYPELDAAILNFELELEAAARKNAVPVDGQIKAQLFKKLSLHQQPAVAPGTTGPRKIIAFSRPLAAAAAVLIIASVGYNIYAYQRVKILERENKDLAMERSELYTQNATLRTKAEELNAGLLLFSDPASLKIALTGIKETASTKAVVIWNKTNKEVHLMIKGLPTPPRDKQYQLWALVNGTPVDAGVISDCATFCLLKHIDNAQAFAITLEKAGGNATPSLDQLQAMGKVPG